MVVNVCGFAEVLCVAIALALEQVQGFAVDSVVENRRVPAGSSACRRPVLRRCTRKFRLREIHQCSRNALQYLR